MFPQHGAQVPHMEVGQRQHRATDRDKMCFLSPLKFLYYIAKFLKSPLPLPLTALFKK